MKFFKGNFTESSADAYAHGCNAQGVMGSGAALDVKTKWPWIYDVYHKGITTDISFYEDVVGFVYTGYVIPEDNHSKPVFNIITQENYGKDGNCFS